jgi:hypothetical protein
MRYFNKVELRLVPDGPASSSADVFDFRSRQAESSRLRRIAALEYENELLRRAASAIQLQLVGHGKSYSDEWLEAMAWMSSRED